MAIFEYYWVGAGFLEWTGNEVFTVNRIIGIGEYPGIEIVSGCNGIVAMGLFLGFILAYRSDLFGIPKRLAANFK